jgi:RNA polymerase sigma-70 factor (ECF subfamily)
MHGQTTCWTLVHGAARGVEKDVDTFVGLYAPVVRSYLVERWRSATHRADLEDAMQEVFMECFKEGGVLDRVGAESLGSFRAFLLGVVRNVSRRFETRHGRKKEIQPPTEFDPDEVTADEERLSIVFDRSWARALLREAGIRQVERARILGEDAEKRVELLRLRFQEGKTLREIAHDWNVEHLKLRRQNARALKEFEDALREVIAFHYPKAPAEAEKEMAAILAMVVGGKG